jgi:hypothetical protein
MLNLKKGNTVRGLKRVLETWAWRFLVIGIMLILIENVGIVGAILKSWGDINPDQTNHFVFEIGIAFTVAAFLILTSERVLKTEMEEKFVKYLKDIKSASASNLDDIRTEYRYTLRNLNNLHSLSHFLSDLHDNANVSNEIRALARDILGDYAIGLRTTNDGFIVEERNWWVEIMKRFYRILQDPHYNCSNAEIRVTHPGPIGIWSNWDEIQDTLTAQRDLVNGKNVTIRRVFVGTEDISPDLDDNSTHAKVINDMSEYKILRYYVKRQNPGMIRDVTWIPDLGFFIEWFVRPGGSVEEIKIRSDATERRELETMWQGLMNDIGSGRGFEAQNNAEIARDLAAKRSASLSLVA